MAVNTSPLVSPNLHAFQTGKVVADASQERIAKKKQNAISKKLPSSVSFPSLSFFFDKCGRCC